MKLPRPKSFRVPLTQNQKRSLTNIGEPFSDDFADLIYHISDHGRKVMIVSDNAGSVVSGGEIFSGNERGTFNNILEYTLSLTEEPVSNLAFISWQRAHVERGRGNKDDLRRIATANQVFYSRLSYMIGKMKPDVVILCGTEPFIALYNQFVGDRRYAYNMNRILEGEIYGHTFQYLGTADIFRPCSWEPKHRNFGQLIGWIIKGWRQAINGRPDYTVDVSKTVFHYIDTISKFDAFYKKLCSATITAMDTEGSGLGRITSKLFSFQFAFSGMEGYFLPFEHPATPFSADEIDYIRTKLRDYYERGKSHYHIWQYAKYDVTQLYANLGLRFYCHAIYDTMAARWTIDENLKALRIFGVSPNGLEYMTEADYNCDIYQRIEFSKGDRKNIGTEGLTKRLIEYGIYDVVVIFQIQEFQIHEARVTGHKKFLRYVTIQKSDKIIALAQMEFTGAPVDRKQIYKLASAEGPVTKTIAMTMEKFKNSPHAKKVNQYLLKQKGRASGDMFGGETWLFDVANAQCKQLLFFNANKLEPLSLNKDGTGSTNKAFIQRYMNENADVHTFAEWTKARTIKNNFVKTLLEKVQEDPDTLKDGRVRSSYNYTVVVGGRLSCLDGQTPVAVLDSRCDVPIKDIKIGDWVWAFGEDLFPVPRRVTWSGKTGIQETITVMYQGYKDGQGVKYIICTPCHPFRLRDGTYRRADELKSGDRVLALERKYAGTNRSYRIMNFTGYKAYRDRYQAKDKPWEHRVVMRCTNPHKVVHHKNEVKDYNTPENLEIMSQSRHAQIHGRQWTKERIKKMVRTRDFLIKTGRIVPYKREGNKNPNYRHLDKDSIIIALEKAKWRPVVAAELINMDFTTFKKKMDFYKIDWKSERKMFNGDNVRISEEMLDYAAKLPNYNEAASFLKVNHYKARELLAQDNNHEIIRIFKNDGVRDVYDITVEHDHNFIANGVCVHNSVEPNLQNLPNKDDKTFSEAFSKELKKAFIAEKYCMIEGADLSANEVRQWCNESKDTLLAESFYQGMDMRRKMRVHAYTFPDELASWTKYKKDTGWDDLKVKEVNGKKITVHAQKMAILGKINDPNVQNFGTLELSLSVAGDLHYVNASIAFQVDVLDVTPEQRYDIKAIVFGKIYGKIALSFAKSRAEGGLGYSEEECQSIMDRIFNKFKDGNRWIEETQDFGFNNLFVESPLGMRRHLWAYLHTRPAFINAMHRRGPNASLQGTASEFGVTAIRLIQWLLWNFFTKHDIPIYWKTVNNYVHDATYSMCPIPFLPVYTYLREHAATTLAHRYYEKNFGYHLVIGIEGESQLGSSLANLKKWDFSGQNMLELVENNIKYQKENFGYIYTPQEESRMLRGLNHNMKIISRLRKRELEIELEKESRVAKTMLMTETNARSLGLDYGLKGLFLT